MSGITEFVFLWHWLISPSIVPSRFIHVVECAKKFFLRLNNILLSLHITSCLSTHRWILGLFLPFGYCGIMLLWPWVCKYLLETLLLIILGTYPEVELLGHMVTWCLIFLRSCHTIFHSSYSILPFFFFFLPAIQKGSSFSTPSATLVFCCCLFFK